MYNFYSKFNFFIKWAIFLYAPFYAGEAFPVEVQNLIHSATESNSSPLFISELMSFGLILFGFACLFAEIMLPSYGVFALSGTLAFALGALILCEIVSPGCPIAWIITILAIIIFVITVAIAIFFLRARRKTLLHGAETLIGLEGTTLNTIEDTGQALINGEIWQVRSAKSIQAQQRIKVIAVEGITLLVEAI